MVLFAGVLLILKLCGRKTIWNRRGRDTGGTAKPGRFGSLAVAMKNRHFRAESSRILAVKARKSISEDFSGDRGYHFTVVLSISGYLRSLCGRSLSSAKFSEVWNLKPFPDNCKKIITKTHGPAS